MAEYSEKMGKSWDFIPVPKGHFNLSNAILVKKPK